MVQIRHKDITVLEKLRETEMVVYLAMDKIIDVPVYNESISSINNGSPFARKSLNPGESAVMVVGPVEDNIPQRFLDSFPGMLHSIIQSISHIPQFWISSGQVQSVVVTFLLIRIELDPNAWELFIFCIRIAHTFHQLFAFKKGKYNWLCLLTLRFCEREDRFAPHGCIGVGAGRQQHILARFNRVVVHNPSSGCRTS